MNRLSLAFLNGPEVVVILALALVLFGSKRLPELARGLGQGLREFKKATREVTDDLQSQLYETPAPKQLQPAAPATPMAAPIQEPAAEGESVPRKS